jgi:hypothetical protein
LGSNKVLLNSEVVSDVDFSILDANNIDVIGPYAINANEIQSGIPYAATNNFVFSGKKICPSGIYDVDFNQKDIILNGDMSLEENAFNGNVYNLKNIDITNLTGSMYYSSLGDFETQAYQTLNVITLKATDNINDLFVDVFGGSTNMYDFSNYILETTNGKDDVNANKFCNYFNNYAENEDFTQLYYYMNTMNPIYFDQYGMYPMPNPIIHSPDPL